MATPVNTPSMGNAQSGIGKVSASTVSATFNKPVWFEHMFTQFPQYSVAPVLEMMGRIEAIPALDWNWSEIARTRQKLNITNNGGNPVTTLTPATTVTVEVDGTVQYAIVGDVFETPTRKLAVVTAVAAGVTGDWKLTLESFSGSLADADFPVDNGLLHRYNINKECSLAPESRVWQPTNFSGKLATLRRRCQVCDHEAHRIKWINGEDGRPYWHHTNMVITEREFVQDRENLIMFGQTATTSGNGQSGVGIFPAIFANGVTMTFAGAPQEDDLIDIIQQLKIYGNASEYFVLCGIKFMTAITKALKDYQIDAVDYGVFPNASVYGLNVAKYNFNGTILNFQEYPLFTDPNLNAGTSGFDYQNAALFLDLGVDDGGEPLIKLMTQANQFGGDNSFQYTEGSGFPQLFGQEGNPSQGDGEACWKGDYYGILGVQIAVLNRHGLMYAA